MNQVPTLTQSACLRADPRAPTTQQLRSSYDYIKAVRGWMLDKLDEDGALGCPTYTRSGKVFSLELLDNIMKVSFLHDTIGLEDGLAIVDLAPGNGSFAYRLTTLFPKCAVVCVQDTGQADSYLKYRGCSNALVVPTKQMDGVLLKAKCVIGDKSRGAWMDKVTGAEVKYVITESDVNTGEMSSRRYAIKASRPKWPIGFDGYDANTYYCWEQM